MRVNFTVGVASALLLSRHFVCACVPSSVLVHGNYGGDANRCICHSSCV